jgi:hypothetical protein
VYHYEDQRFPHHLTGLTDENGGRFATWAYPNFLNSPQEMPSF